MTARCHTDTCSVEWSEVNTGSGPAYQADVITDGEGVTNGKDPGDPTIQCGDDGLEVIINQVDTNILQSTPFGLLATLPVSNVITLSSNPDNKGVSPSADESTPQSSDEYDWTNSTGRDALVLVSGEFNFDYGILGPTHAYSYAAGNGQRAGRWKSTSFEAGEDPPNAIVPYNAQLAMRLLANIDSAPVTSRKACRVGIGGTIHVSTSAGAELKVERVPFFWMVRVPDGSQLRMKSQAFYQGPSQTINVAAAPGVGAGLAGTGHELWNLQVAAVPI